MKPGRKHVLSSNQLAAIRVMLQVGTRQKVIAAKFDITQGMVSHIATGRSHDKRRASQDV